MTTIGMLRLAKVVGLFAAASALVSCTLTMQAQEDCSGAAADEALTLHASGFAPHRFIAAHGRRALIDGDAAGSLEAWVYPFQILSGYRVDFRMAGTASSIRGPEILSRVDFDPDSVKRVYLGPGFVVRERIYIPQDRPGAILTYSMRGRVPVEVEIHAVPVLNLMWPGAVGGQSVEWDAADSAYVLSEPEHGFTAIIGSPEIVAHDSPVNAANRPAEGSGIGFTLRPLSGVARVFIVLNPAHTADRSAAYHELIRDSNSFASEAAKQLSELRGGMLRLETPDDRVNRLFAWSEIALDQAWVCNPSLGCGYVAGYGPSRGERRPQYDWFFAGDGLIAADAALSAGDPARARAELKFILSYQNKTSGMIWHELSQSAALIDWARKYPYMFIHVDTTFAFLDTVARYVTATGDLSFLCEHWDAIETAYRYCGLLVDPATELPRIPAGKEGVDEQDHMTDSLDLSAAWVDASESFARLASLTGHDALAGAAVEAARRARKSIPRRYWNSRTSFWISGHTQAGEPLPELRSGPPEALALHLFSAMRQDLLLDALASSSFQTDWGTRSIGPGPGFDPQSYAKGSVWPIQTANLANIFWSEHRPVTALSLWSTLLPLGSLDSPGHIPEVLSGDVFRTQTESVPEQTWSSAGFLDATIHGLLGMQVDSLAHRLVFAPRLPDVWCGLLLKNVQLEGRRISLALHRTNSGVVLDVDNIGDSFQLEFAPDLPLGATLRTAEFNRHAIHAAAEDDPQQTEAALTVLVPRGKSQLKLNWAGGVSLSVASPDPLLGDASSGVHVVGVRLDGRRWTMEADVPSDRESSVSLHTAWSIADVDGARAQPRDGEHIDLIFASTGAAPGSYRRARATMEFKP